MTFPRSCCDIRRPGLFLPFVAMLCVAVALALASPAAGQDDDKPTAEVRRGGVLSEAVFDVAFRKYTPPDTAFSPYYSWDAEIVADLTLFRRRATAVDFTGLIQTVGTENLGSQVSVGGTGYILRAAFRYDRSKDLSLFAGISHLSSHLTRDLDEKTDAQRSLGVAVPTVRDPSEYNVVFLRAQLQRARWPLAPRLDVIVQPLNFRFDGGGAPDVRPLCVATGVTVWRGRRASLEAETRHEVGYNAFHYFAAVIQLFPGNERGGRLQLFVGGSPGRGFHVSPNVGGVRDGIAIGVRMRFRS